MVKTFMRGFVAPVIALFLMSGAAFAQPDSCDIPIGDYCSYTQGGWGSLCRGGNAGCIRDNNFATCFPGGLVIGGDYTISFSTAADVAAFLPTGDPPAPLTQNHVNPILPTEAGVFAGQVMALALTMGFGDCGVLVDIGHLVVVRGYPNPYGPFAGWTVDEVFALANDVLGGDVDALPPGYDVSMLNDVITAINENFVDCLISGDYLAEPGCDYILPVEITGFNAIAGLDVVALQWRTQSENDVASYELSRREGAGAWTSIAIIASRGNSPAGFSYRYDDRNLATGQTYAYRLIVHNLDGSQTVHGKVASATPAGAAPVTEFALEQNYPNPFNPATQISYHLTEKSAVKLAVFDLTGREVATLVQATQDAGSHSVTFNAAGLATGVYFYRLEAGPQVAVRKLMLMK